MRDPVAAPVALVGPMGAGKSAVARALGERWGAAVADLDALAVDRTGRSVGELFAARGESWFRAFEAGLLDEVLGTGVAVIACGGGIVLDGGAREALRSRCRTVWLDVAPEEASRRLGPAEVAARPLLQGVDRAAAWERLRSEREPHYREVAVLRVATDGHSVDEVAAIIDQALGPRG